MSHASAKLLEIEATLSDAEVAARCADVLTEHEPETYYLAIDHDVRAAAAKSSKPKTGRPPVEYTWAHKEQIGIDTRSRGMALHWATTALLAGYTVTRCDRNRMPTGIDYSIERVRARAAFHQTAKYLGDDDDIPF